MGEALVVGRRAGDRGILRLMVDPSFGSLFWAKMLTSTGVWMHGLVAAIVVFDLTHSTFAVGLVGAAQFLPPLLLTAWSGTLADKGGIRFQILLGRAVCVAGSGLAGLWLLLAPDSADSTVAAVIFIGSLMVGVGFVLGGPAMQSIVPAMVRPGELAAAMALNTAPSTTSRVTGPLVGALAYGSLGAGWSFALSALTHFTFFFVAVLITIPEPDQDHDPGRDMSVRGGLKYVWAKRPLLAYLGIVALAALGAEPSLTLAPGLAHEFGGDTRMVGVLSAAFGGGAVIGLVLASIRFVDRVPATVSLVGLVFMGSSFASIAAFPSFTLAAIAFPVAGIGFALTLTSASTEIQRLSPDDMRGRIMGLWIVAYVGARPLGSTSFGAIADATSLRGSLLSVVVLLVLLGGLCSYVLRSPKYRTASETEQATTSV